MVCFSWWEQTTQQLWHWSTSFDIIQEISLYVNNELRRQLVYPPLFMNNETHHIHTTERTKSFTQLYWRLCINTHAHFKCKPKWTQVQPNLETLIMSSCKDVLIILSYFFYKKFPKQTHPFFLKNIPSLTRAQARFCKLACRWGLKPHFPHPPDTSLLAKVLNILSVYY